jgi:hypothetical protein
VDELISVSALIDSLQLTSEEQEELGLMSIVTSKQGSSDACGCRTTSDSQEAPLLLSAQELEALFGDLQLLGAVPPAMEMCSCAASQRVHAVSSACASIEPAAPESLDSAELEGLDRAWALLSASEGIELLQVLEQDAQQLADADLRQKFDDDEEANHGGSNMNMDDVDD